MRRVVVAAVLCASISVFVLPALAQEEAPPPEQAPSSGELIEPAVVVPVAVDDAPEPQWTYKFLVPLGLLVGALAVFVTVLQYFVSVVRSRYKLVE